MRLSGWDMKNNGGRGWRYAALSDNANRGLNNS